MNWSVLFCCRGFFWSAILMIGLWLHISHGKCVTRTVLCEILPHFDTWSVQCDRLAFDSESMWFIGFSMEVAEKWLSRFFCSSKLYGMRLRKSWATAKNRTFGLFIAKIVVDRKKKRFGFTWKWFLLLLSIIYSSSKCKCMAHQCNLMKLCLFAPHSGMKKKKKNTLEIANFFLIWVM